MPLVHNTVHHPINGTPAEGAKVTVSLVATLVGVGPGYQGEAGRTIQGYSKTETDALGLWSATLVANGDLSPESTFYEVEERIPGHPPIRHNLAVPDAATTTLTGQHVFPVVTVTVASAASFEAASAAAPRWANVGGQLVRYTGKGATTLTGVTGGTGTIANGATVEQAYWVGDILTSPPVGLPHLHILDPLDAHDASAISVVPAGNLAATDAQAALVELDAQDTAEAAARLAADTAETAARVAADALRALDTAVVHITGDETVAGVKDWTGAQRNGSGDPVYHVRSKAFNNGLWSTAAERRATIAACFAAMAASGVGGTAVLPPGAHDLSGGTVPLPNAYSNVHTTYRLIGNNTRLTTTTAHPIFADDMPANNSAAVDRASRRFIVEGIHFQGTSLIGQVGLRIVGSYLSEIRHCSFQFLEDGLDLIFCLGATVASCGFHSCLNHSQRHRYGMEIDNGIGTRTPLWSGAAETNSNGNCPTISKCRDYGLVPPAARTVVNKELASNVVTLTTSAAHGFTAGRWVLVKGMGAPYDGLWKVQSTPTTTTFTYNRTGTNEASTAVAGTPRTVTDAVLATTNPTLTSATAAFLLSDIGATVAHANYPSGSTTITGIVSPTQVNTATVPSGAASGQTVTITRPTTVQMGQKAQIAFEGISEIIADGIINEGGQAICGVYYDQGGSTSSKGLTIRDSHPEHQPLLASMVLVGTGGGHVVIDGGTWTQGTCMMDATGFTTGTVHWHNQSVHFGKIRDKASSQVVWCFQAFGTTGTDPTLTSLWDGSVPLYYLPILRGANGTTEPGFGNAGVLAFKGSGVIQSTATISFLSSVVSPNFSVFFPPGFSLGLWNAAPNPAANVADRMWIWKKESDTTLQLVVKNSANTAFTVPISYLSPGLFAGTGSPEGVRTAPVGSIYQRTDGGAATSFYVKESGAGNTGWVAK